MNHRHSKEQQGGLCIDLPSKLSTTVNKIHQLTNQKNAELICQFHEFMKENGATERHQNNNLKTILSYTQFLDARLLLDVNIREDILSFLQTKIKDKVSDPDQKWITTYNDYLHRIKHFFRWMYNKNDPQINSWITPQFLHI